MASLDEKLALRELELRAQKEGLSELFILNADGAILQFKPIDMLESQLDDALKNQDKTLYHQAYQGILEKAIQALKVDSHDELTHLRRLLFVIDGQYDALKLCLEYLTQPDEIRRKIQDKEKFLLSGRPTAAPNTSTRLYTDGFLEELKSWLENIENV